MEIRSGSRSVGHNDLNTCQRGAEIFKGTAALRFGVTKMREALQV